MNLTFLRFDVFAFLIHHKGVAIFKDINEKKQKSNSYINTNTNNNFAQYSH